MTSTLAAAPLDLTGDRPRKLLNYVAGEWVEGTGLFTTLHHAVTGAPVAEASSEGIDFAAMVSYARRVGGPALRKMTFHERALMLKAMAQYLTARKDDFYRVSAATGATKTDSWIDIDGGIGTFFIYASKGRRELPNETFYVDGATEALSKGGSFVGRHVCVPLEGVAVHVNTEADSLNFSMLGPDAGPGTEEFDLFVKEVAKEMTVKAGQKCTAIRRTLVPEGAVEPLMQALVRRLEGVKVGDPAMEGVRMGPLAAQPQVREVRKNVDAIARQTERVFGNPDDFDVVGADRGRGAFFPTLLFYAKDPFESAAPHDVEAFGPVNTVMPYKSVDDAIELAKRGRGSLVGSLFTADDRVAKQVVLVTASHHGRLMVVHGQSDEDSTEPGSLF